MNDFTKTKCYFQKEKKQISLLMTPNGKKEKASAYDEMLINNASNKLVLFA